MAEQIMWEGGRVYGTILLGQKVTQSLHAAQSDASICVQEHITPANKQ
jgi:hypothetical protein